MFRSRRSALVKPLVRAANETARPVEALLKSLSTGQLEALLVSVESRGAERGPCLLLLASGLRLGRGAGPLAPPHVLFCRLWRWADLRTAGELKRLPACEAPRDPMYICSNPYHWTRIYKPDSPPPPYSRHPQELSKLPENLQIESQETRCSHISGCNDSPRPWCEIAYWEMSDRVGRLLPVTQPAINVFANLPHGDGLCLETLARHSRASSNSNSSITRTRAKIGSGVTIFKEDQEIWVYNRSEYAIFVNSPTLDPPNMAQLTVYKVPPGYSVKIFDYETSRHNQSVQDSSLYTEGPFNPYTVQISFVKGWGPHYSRRFITSCPCRLEVIFLVNR